MQIVEFDLTLNGGAYQIWSHMKIEGAYASLNDMVIDAIMTMHKLQIASSRTNVKLQIEMKKGRPLIDTIRKLEEPIVYRADSEANSPYKVFEDLS